MPYCQCVCLCLSLCVCVSVCVITTRARAMPVLSFCLAHFVVIIWNFDQVFRLKYPLPLPYLSLSLSPVCFLYCYFFFLLLFFAYVAFFRGQPAWLGFKGELWALRVAEPYNTTTYTHSHTHAKACIDMHRCAWPGHMWAVKARVDFDHVVPGPLGTWTVSSGFFAKQRNSLAGFAWKLAAAAGLQFTWAELPCDRCGDLGKTVLSSNFWRDLAETF